MHKYLNYAAYGWLVLSGTMHFLVDVVSQHLRQKRAPGPEATMFYGMNSAYALSQVLYGVLGLLVARAAPHLLDQWPTRSLSLVAAACWLVFGFLFIEFWEPKIAAGIFAVLVIAAAATA